VRAEITIGSVVYDSIPATLHISSFDSAGKMTTQVVELEPGTNTFALYGHHARYTLRMTQWGLSDEVTVTRAELATKGVIRLAASRSAKLLKSEAHFRITSAGTQYTDQTNYVYDGAGRLIRAFYYRQRTDMNQVDFVYVDKFFYEGSQLDRIERYDAKVDTSFAPASFTAFNHYADGRIAEMYNNQSVETAARVSYDKQNHFDITSIYYNFKDGGGTREMNYTMKYLGGNKVEETAISSTNVSERAGFSYDFNINPYIHMNHPDLYLSRYSKNNVTGVTRSYSGAQAVTDPYKWEYMYGMDGYPQQLLRSFKASSTGQHLYAIQTMFTYY
jgi:hypothetical protein